MLKNPVTPYAVVGAGSLTATLYKTGGERTGFRYRFNVIRLDRRTGRVSHWFGPADFLQLLKLMRVLTAELDADGCIDSDLRRQLRQIAELLDLFLGEIRPIHPQDGVCPR